MGIAELEFASLVEKTLTVKPFYDETIIIRFSKMIKSHMGPRQDSS